MRRTIVPVAYRLNMVVGFHPDAVNCDGCPFCLTDAFNRDRKRCVLTDEVLFYTKQMGLRCPLVKEEECDETDVQDAPR